MTHPSGLLNHLKYNKHKSRLATKMNKKVCSENCALLVLPRALKSEILNVFATHTHTAKSLPSYVYMNLLCPYCATALLCL